MKKVDFYSIKEEEFKRAIEFYDDNERYESTYQKTVDKINKYWDTNIPEVTKTLKTFLKHWNPKHNPKGFTNDGDVAECLLKNINLINKFRIRKNSSLEDSDEGDIRYYFREFMSPLSVWKGDTYYHAYVSTAKVIHVLAPDFFPMWDNNIAHAYGIYFDKDKIDEQYFTFCKLIKEFAEHVQSFNIESDKSILKLIDEYNYVTYTLANKLRQS